MLTDIGTKSQVTKYCNDLIDDHTRSDRRADNRVEALLRVSPQLIVNGEHLIVINTVPKSKESMPYVLCARKGKHLHRERGREAGCKVDPMDFAYLRGTLYRSEVTRDDDDDEVYCQKYALVNNDQ